MYKGILNDYKILVCYYHNRDLIEEYKPISDWDSKWTSPSEDSKFEDDPDIDGPEHTKDYLDLWQRHSSHILGIHKED